MTPDLDLLNLKVQVAQEHARQKGDEAPKDEVVLQVNRDGHSKRHSHPAGYPGKSRDEGEDDHRSAELDGQRPQIRIVRVVVDIKLVSLRKPLADGVCSPNLHVSPVHQLTEEVEGMRRDPRRDGHAGESNGAKPRYVKLDHEGTAQGDKGRGDKEPGMSSKDTRRKRGAHLGEAALTG